MSLQPSSPVPLYHQLAQTLTSRIAAGQYHGGLPGELELMSEFGVSRGTVRQALDRLVRNGLIDRQRGRGSFVNPLPLEYPVGRFYRFAHEMSERGIPESSRVLTQRRVQVRGRLARDLAVASGAAAVRLVRVRLAGEYAFLLETSHVPFELAPSLLDADLSHGSVYDVLEAEGTGVTRVTEEVKATLLTTKDAARFDLDAGTPALAVERLAWAGERPAEHRLVLAPADRVTLTASWGQDATP